MRPLSWIAWDRFALSQIRQEYGLTGVEYSVLGTVTWQADPFTKTWTGDATSLGEDIGHERRTVSDALRHLIEIGILDEEQPFARGHRGRVFITVWDRLVRLDDSGHKAVIRRSQGAHKEESRRASRENPRPLRDLGMKGSKGEGLKALNERKCVCGLSLADHPLDSDHEPKAAVGIGPPSVAEDPFWAGFERGPS